MQCEASDQPSRDVGKFDPGAGVSGDCRSTVYPHSWWSFHGPVRGWSRSTGGAPIGHAGLAATRVSSSLAPGPSRSRPTASVGPVPLAPSSLSPSRSLVDPSLRSHRLRPAFPLAACSCSFLMPLLRSRRRSGMAGTAHHAPTWCASPPPACGPAQQPPCSSRCVQPGPLPTS